MIYAHDTLTPLMPTPPAIDRHTMSCIRHADICYMRAACWLLIRYASARRQRLMRYAFRSYAVFRRFARCCAAAIMR